MLKAPCPWTIRKSQIVKIEKKITIDKNKIALLAANIETNLEPMLKTVNVRIIFFKFAKVTYFRESLRTQR